MWESAFMRSNPKYQTSICPNVHRPLRFALAHLGLISQKRLCDARCSMYHDRVCLRSGHSLRITFPRNWSRRRMISRYSV